jgi:hypothetical protein
MTENKVRSFKELLEQAKTSLEVRELVKGNGTYWQTKEKWVSVGLVEQYHERLSEKECRLRKLLDDFPCCEDCTIYEKERETCYNCPFRQARIWLENLKREFEGLSKIIGENGK